MQIETTLCNIHNMSFFYSTLAISVISKKEILERDLVKTYKIPLFRPILSSNIFNCKNVAYNL